MTETTKITTLDNGPFLVKGSAVVTDAEGNQFNSQSKAIALCRCGGAGTRPFCDGSHSKLGFQSEERAN